MTYKGKTKVKNGKEKKKGKEKKFKFKQKIRKKFSISSNEKKESNPRNQTFYKMNETETNLEKKNKRLSDPIIFESKNNSSDLQIQLLSNSKDQKNGKESNNQDDKESKEQKVSIESIDCGARVEEEFHFREEKQFPFIEEKKFERKEKDLFKFLSNSSANTPTTIESKEKLKQSKKKPLTRSLIKKFTTNDLFPIMRDQVSGVKTHIYILPPKPNQIIPYAYFAFFGIFFYSFGKAFPNRQKF